MSRRWEPNQRLFAVAVGCQINNITHSHCTHVPAWQSVHVHTAMDGHILGMCASLPSPKELRFWFGLFVCLSVRRITENVVNGFWRHFLEGQGMAKETMGSILVTMRITGTLSFDCQARSIGSPKSEIRIHWIIEKLTNGFWWNFMESWGVAQRPTDNILVTICITIRIRESVPDHDLDPRRTATLSTHTEQMHSWILAQGPSDYIFLTIRITVRIQESEIRIHWILAFGGCLHSLSTSS